MSKKEAGAEVTANTEVATGKKSFFLFLFHKKINVLVIMNAKLTVSQVYSVSELL